VFGGGDHDDEDACRKAGGGQQGGGELAGVNALSRKHVRAARPAAARVAAGGAELVLPAEMEGESPPSMTRRSVATSSSS
jgi:hypothetical protein